MTIDENVFGIDHNFGVKVKEFKLLQTHGDARTVHASKIPTTRRWWAFGPLVPVLTPQGDNETGNVLE